MRNRRLPVALVLVALSLQGCAGFLFDDEESTGDGQTVSMTCPEIDAEMLKVMAFVDQLNKEGSYTWQDVMTIVENFKIGNSPEKSVAQKTANERMVQLWNMRDAKKCGGAGSHQPITIPIRGPEVIKDF